MIVMTVDRLFILRCSSSFWFVLVWRVTIININLFPKLLENVLRFLARYTLKKLYDKYNLCNNIKSDNVIVRPSSNVAWLIPVRDSNHKDPFFNRPIQDFCTPCRNRTKFSNSGLFKSSGVYSKRSANCALYFLWQVYEQFVNRDRNINYSSHVLYLTKLMKFSFYNNIPKQAVYRFAGQSV